MKPFPAVPRTEVPPGTHFSKAFLASIPPFDPSKQTEANGPEAAAMFERVEARLVGGWSGLMLLYRTAVVHGSLPESAIILREDVK